MAKCDICNKGVTFGIQVSHSHRRSKSNLEAERSSRKGYGRWYSPPYQRMYSVPPFRQGYPRYLILTICAFTLKCQSALFAERFSFTLIVCR